MRVIFWGTYDSGKPRTRILRKGLRIAGVDLQEINASPWDGIEDKSQIRGKLSRSRVLVRWLLFYPGLAWRLIRAPRPDVILLGYPGILDVFVAMPIARLRGIPVVWDVFLSMYDTVCVDRGLAAPGGAIGRALFWIERAALRWVDLAFLDTRAHAQRIGSLFDLGKNACDSVWVGVESEYFSSAAAEIPAQPSAATMRVLFYGQFIPLHGISFIVEAARLLRDEPIEWQLVGRGQQAGDIHAMLEADPLPRLKWTEWVEYTQLQAWLTRADVCLGIFGLSDKAASVIPNKVFQIVAAGRPIITRDSPAIRELLSPEAPCTYLVPAGDAAALAEAILTHSRNYARCTSACHAGRSKEIDASAIGRQFIEMIERRQLMRVGT